MRCQFTRRWKTPGTEVLPEAAQSGRLDRRSQFWKCIFGKRIRAAMHRCECLDWAILGRVCVITVVLLTTFGESRGDNMSSASRGQLPQLLSADVKRQSATLDLIKSRPMSDNDLLVPWLRENTDRLPPVFLYELARRLYPSDHATALEWYAIGLIRARYDANRCSEASVGRDIGALAWRSAPVPTYGANHPDELASALFRALKRDDLFSDQISPLWICAPGLAGDQGNQAEPILDTTAVKPQSEWPL